MNLTSAFYDVLAGDATLVSLLSTYESNPAIFTVDPAPGDATLPYIVAAGHVADVPFDTKTEEGREVTRDVRCYDAADGSSVTVEAMAERVRALFHRQTFTIDGFGVIVSECTGPIVADETVGEIGGDAYGRIVSVRVIAQEVS